ncbi:Thermopsin [Metallosphaera sp. J1]|uniref:thermopsin n=1 Tax=Metallosphaera javensis (ex Hofmann et al. 2022) TaxID=99938 RepID=UPI001EDF14A7|nr:thermopsin [Metallosphaera javensis (ex Hofmann et al. 2022)]MCG3108202.1 Thermopsin [Metallosphaera javensis (ex Hofmann et al. 2022)]
MKWLLFTILLGISLFPAFSLEAPSSVILSAGQYEYIPLNVNTTEILSYSWNSTGSVAVMVMNQSQLQEFLNTTGNPYKGVAILNSSFSNQVLLTPGKYYLVLYAYLQQVTLQYTMRLSPAQVSYTLPPGYQENYRLNLTYPFHLYLYLVSNNSFSLQVTSGNVTYFSVGPSRDEPLTFVNRTLTLNPGNYSITVINPGSSTLAIYSSVLYAPTYPDPLSLNRTDFPMGVASYGLFNRSGVPVPYVVRASSVIGFANISSILAYNQTAKELNVSPYSASLQLNVPLVVVNGKENQTYWVQNVIVFITNESTLCFQSSVLNVTNENATLTNVTIQGKGGVYPPFNNGVYYTYRTQSVEYRTPLSLLVSVNVSILKKLGVRIGFDYKLIENGTVVNGSWKQFDSSLILDPSATQAYLYVNGYNSPPTLNFYDAELVFGGGGNGEVAYFQNLSASLALFYYNGSLHPFPSIYSFGADTAEGSSDLHVSLMNNLVSVSKGQQNPVFLTNQFNASIPTLRTVITPVHNQTNTITKTQTNTTTSTTSSTNTTKKVTPPPSNSTQTSSTQTSGVPATKGTGLPPYLIPGVVVGVIVIAVAWILINRFRKPTLDI